MYKAIDLARYVVDYCAKNDAPVSNLQLQKMLYFLWIDYEKGMGVPLFCDEFYAWQLGPVIPTVYVEFCSYGGFPINEQFSNIFIRDTDRRIINCTIDHYMYESVSNLISLTHRVGGAWDAIFRNGQGKKSLIPFGYILALEVNR